MSKFLSINEGIICIKDNLFKNNWISYTYYLSSTCKYIRSFHSKRTGSGNGKFSEFKFTNSGYPSSNWDNKRTILEL